MANDLLPKTENAPVPKYDNMAAGYQSALQLVEDVVLKSYISGLSDLDIVPLSQSVLDTNLEENVLFFKITEMVYEKEEFAPYKFASVFNTLASSNAGIFVIMDSDGEKTDFYMGIRSLDNEKTTSSIRNTLENAMSGQFPGIKTKNYDLDEMKKIMAGIKGNSIAAVSCVANGREEDIKHNQNFVQGLEKLVLSMRGQKYTGIIIANATDQTQLRELRRCYESIYSQLSPFATTQVNYGQNASAGKSESKSEARTRTTTKTINESETNSTTNSYSTSKGSSTSKGGSSSKLIKNLISTAGIVGAALSPFTAGITGGIGGLISGGLGLMGSTTGSSTSNTVTSSKSTSNSKTYGESTSESEGLTSTNTTGTSMTKGLSNAITLTAHNKTIENMLSRIDKQLKRIDEFETLGMYECAAYFLSENQYAADIAATTYKAIMRGENSGVESAAINSWGSCEKRKTALIEQYVKNFIHPVFEYSGSVGDIEVTPSAMVSGSELAIHMGLPRKSVCGLPVIEHADFGKEVVRYDQESFQSGINLGKVFNMGRSCLNNVRLDKSSLSMHTFVTGSTGSGKSNTTYELIRQTNNLGIKFMVIEPAKGEYKNVFGHYTDVQVYGTNPESAELLKINPFKFASKIHILEHVDRLVEIFNVCWPMYAAMPAVLKDAILKSYEDCGWDLSSSNNIYGVQLYPTFIDLQESLEEVIHSSAYSEEVKSNYKGSLMTRVKSLTNGLNGQIFTSGEIPGEVLFDSNVIVDLSRIGSLETKSLIMGLLIMQLSEYRMSSADAMNVPLKHMTILEEAHHILKRTSSEQNSESPSLAGKSVEMISNAIAEMRTYGEGFVIVDQSPSAVDSSAIRNTNTKIIMRLPDESDRRLAGKSAGLRDSQLDEIAKLPKGVAVVYQNDWVEPVLCQVQKYKGEEQQYQYKPERNLHQSTDRLKRHLLELLLKTRVKNPVDINIDAIKEDLFTAEISTKSKLMIKKIIDQYTNFQEISLWKEENFERLSKIVSSILEGEIWLKSVMGTVSRFDVLTDQMICEIKKQVRGLSLEYLVASAQCVLRAEIKKSDNYGKIYSGWITMLKNKGEI
ncbi:ATP-binding protein [Lachnospiraceae bacterium oral taxon 096]|jgi:hypothetical protein|nr:ATP-binding protein [Lachnospiraceae bacterium oral taxon 096]QUI95892.1 ATP-binding protein [Lachnospiraceae bacterium oral taxon 096]